jgi:hypothetical protein
MTGIGPPDHHGECPVTKIGLVPGRHNTRQGETHRYRTATKDPIRLVEPGSDVALDLRRGEHLDHELEINGLDAACVPDWTQDDPATNSHIQRAQVFQIARPYPTLRRAPQREPV